MMDFKTLDTRQQWAEIAKRQKANEVTPVKPREGTEVAALGGDTGKPGLRRQN